MIRRGVYTYIHIYIIIFYTYRYNLTYQYLTAATTERYMPYRCNTIAMGSAEPAGGLEGGGQKNKVT